MVPYVVVIRDLKNIQGVNMEIDKQVLYMGRWVDKEHFTCFIYNSDGEKLVKSYKEFSDAISSGIWFATKEDAANDKIAKDKQETASNDKILKMPTKKG